MSEKYTSSIVNLYGDNSKVKEDSQKLKEILDRQGLKLLLHSIANYCGENSVKYNLTSEENNRLMNSILEELKESILERT